MYTVPIGDRDVAGRNYSLVICFPIDNASRGNLCSETCVPLGRRGEPARVSIWNGMGWQQGIIRWNSAGFCSVSLLDVIKETMPKAAAKFRALMIARWECLTICFLDNM